jgi:glycosyltransferase involved in cell wall biosynthesis
MFEDPRVMIFTGDMSFTPNVDAVLWFTKEVLPLVLQKLPDAKLKIVGRDPVPTIKRLNHHGSIEVQGYVPDLTDAIAGSGLYILPMRLGAGFRSKLLDVFPLRKAIVSTSIGAEGLELYHDVNCIIADSAQDFAEGCIRLLKNENERHRLGRAVGSLATETYSQENITRLVRKTVIDILGES